MSQGHSFHRGGADERSYQYASPDFISKLKLIYLSVPCFAVCACVLCVYCLECFQSSACPRGLRGFRSGAVITGQGSFCPVHIPSAARCTVQKNKKIKKKNTHTRRHMHTHAHTHTRCYVLTCLPYGVREAGFRGLPICWETGSVFKQVTSEAENFYTITAVWYIPLFYVHKIFCGSVKV